MATSILIILGSGLYDLYSKELSPPISVRTRFGRAEVSELRGKSKVYVMMRHGKGHRIPPHLINYRANISAAKELEAEFIVATSSVGSLNRTMTVGSYVVVDQFIDFTKSRASSVFYDRPENFAHTDMTNPFSELVRAALILALKGNPKIRYSSKGTYVCTEGPRFETPAEIRMYRKLGADVVGMTGVPEVVIAKELGIPYANLSHVTNMAAGMQSEVTQQEVLTEMSKSSAITRSILDAAVKGLSGKRK